jgi:hypothetical protein
MHKFGVIYVALGRPYLAMALSSFASLRHTNPQVPACVITNAKASPPRESRLWSKRDVWRFVQNEDAENRQIKTLINRWTPFDRTLFLDCDTLVLADIHIVEFFLEHFDLCMRVGNYFMSDRAKLFGGKVQVSQLPHWNSGVIGFRRSPEVDDFFSQWNSLYAELAAHRDQVSLIEAVFKSDCRILSLPEIWNGPDRHLALSRHRRALRIWHYKSDIDARLRRRIIEADAWIDPKNPRQKDTEEYIRSRQADYRRSRGQINQMIRSAVRGVRGNLLPKAWKKPASRPGHFATSQLFRERWQGH